MSINEFRRESSNFRNKNNLENTFNNNDNVLRNMMNEARTKIGIFPVTDQDVRFFCDPTVHSDLKMMESREFYTIRIITMREKLLLMIFANMH